ncbi:DMT family transporter [Patescibacteria group bacterium]|nr:DMT family transporter [Patescibacteria group bacterium]
MSNRLKAYLALLGTALVWGAALPIVKPALNYISPTQFLYFRYLIAAPLLLPFLLKFFLRFRPNLRTVLNIFFVESYSFFGLILLYRGLQLATAIEASLIGATGPIFIVLGGILLLHEKEEKFEWTGLIISFIGTLILVLEPLLTGKNHSAGFSFIGNLMIIGYNLLNVFSVIFQKKLYKHIPKIYVSSLSYPIGLCIFFLILTLTGSSTSVSLLTTPSVMLACGYMAIFGSIVGFTLFIYGQNLIEASEASLFTYLQGIIAIPFAYLMLKESVTWPQIIAVLIVSLGVYLAEQRPKRYNHKS